MDAKYSEFAVVLPTLNEERNIGVLLKNILDEYEGMEVVVVDDGSTDMTKKVVEKISKANKSVRFLDRAAMQRDRGLTASAVEGIISSRVRYAIVMDADLQHPPEVIGKVAAGLLLGNDLVVAIRADVTGWELHRKIISKTLIVIGYLVLLITGKSRCNDIFSGFFGVDRKLFARAYEANRSRFVAGGYKILFDFLKCMRNGSMKIGEVPYSFGTRRFGASKAGFRQGMLLFKSFLT